MKIYCTRWQRLCCHSIIEETILILPDGNDSARDIGFGGRGSGFLRCHPNSCWAGGGQANGRPAID